jgi:hypothetical protein
MRNRPKLASTIVHNPDRMPDRAPRQAARGRVRVGSGSTDYLNCFGSSFDEPKWVQPATNWL